MSVWKRGCLNTKRETRDVFMRGQFNMNRGIGACVCMKEELSFDIHRGRGVLVRRKGFMNVRVSVCL